MNMKRVFALALMALLLCLPVWAMASEKKKTETGTFDGITYKITYPESYTCSKGVTHEMTIVFFWDEFEYNVNNNNALWFNYQVFFSDNDTCMHETSKQATDIKNVPADCTQESRGGRLEIRSKYPKTHGEMTVELVPNTEHHYTWEQENDQHHGKCQNGGCLVTTNSHEISWNDWVSDGENNHTRTCSVPGCTMKETHNASMSEWSGEDGTHTRYCTVNGCNVPAETGACSGGEATCKQKAICTDCGEAYGEIDPNNHNEVIIPAVAPTYTETGLTEGVKCGDCGEILVPQEAVHMLSAAVSDMPKTGDNSNAILWSALACISLLGMATLAHRRKEA